MRDLIALSLAVACLSAQAQTPPPAPPTEAPPPQASPDQKIERIRHEDSGARIDEVRYAGQTQSITVQPKGGATAYDVLPTSGQRVWNVLKF